MSDDIRIIKLKHHIPVPDSEGNPVKQDEILIGRPKLKHLKHFPDSMFEKGSEIDIKDLISFLPKILASLACIPESSAEEVDLEDLESIMTEIQSFLGNIQATTGGK